MFNTLPALSRASQRMARVRARHRATPTAPAAPARNQMSFGESMAVGLGCDNWKFQQR